jgi:hypothetical protein
MTKLPVKVDAETIETGSKRQFFFLIEDVPHRSDADGQKKKKNTV